MSRFLFSSARHPAHPDTPLQALRHFKKPQAAFLFYFTNRVELNSPRFKVLPAAKRLYAHPRAALKGRITLELSSARHPAHPDMPLQALRLLCGLPAGHP